MEIDTGVSGKISNSIADLMVAMGQKLQVIMYLPQVAAKSHYHFKVLKQELEDKTLLILLPLDKERIKEIAIVLSGNQVSSTAIIHQAIDELNVSFEI